MIRHRSQNMSFSTGLVLIIRTHRKKVFGAFKSSQLPVTVIVILAQGQNVLFLILFTVYFSEELVNE